MNAQLLAKLSVITEEEHAILAGQDTVNRALYYRDDSLSHKNEIDASLLLKKGKMIDIRPNTRFIHFPEHTHNFVELVYMCQGTTTHIIDGNRIMLNNGDLLFMNQHARQEIMPAGEKDIAVNFIILPQFFTSVLRRINDVSPALRDFLISCLTETNMGVNYLYFDASSILSVQNLMENLIWNMMNPVKNSRTINQETMTLLFLNLMNYTGNIHMSEKSWEQDLVLKLLNYIDERYRDASLSTFAFINKIDIYTLERLIRKYTEKTFLVLLAEKRMSQAAYLLIHSKMPVGEVSLAVGYENTSYFHRLFMKTYGCTPGCYRRENAGN